MRYYLLIGFILFFAGISCAKTSLYLSNRGVDSVYYPSHHLGTYEDTTGELSWEEIKKIPQKKFNWSSGRDIRNIGVTKSTHWFVFDLSNQAMASKEWYLSIDYPFINQLEIYQESGDSLVKKSILGYDYDFKSREVDITGYATKLDFSEGKNLKVWISARSSYGMVLPFEVLSLEKLLERQGVHQKWWGGYYGVLFIIILITFILAVRTNDRSFYYYSIYILAYTISIYVQVGHFHRYVLTDVNWLHHHIRILLYIGGAIPGIQFVREFYNLKAIFPRFDKWLKGMIIWCWVLLGFTIIFSSTTWIHFLAVCSIITAVMMVIVIGYLFWKRGVAYSLFFLIGWASLMLGIIIRFMTVLGVGFDANFFTLNANLIGSLLEVIFLSISLGSKISVVNEDRRKLQWEIIQSLQENQRIKEEIKSQLEMKVEERASQIVEKVERLELKRQEIQRQRLIQYSLESLRSQMDPHFIFNALNSIRDFVLKNDREESSRYLVKFSHLMRLILDNTREPYISLQQEIAALEAYLEIEQLRYNRKFDFEIIVDEQLVMSKYSVPSMLIQPFVENSIWHGFTGIEYKGKIKVQFELIDGVVVVQIIDNGIGRDRSKELKKNRTRESKGLKIIKKRLELLGLQKEMKLDFEIQDLFENGKGVGTIVKVFIPVFSQNIHRA